MAKAITTKQLGAMLVKAGWKRGLKTAGHPSRDDLKLALNTLAKRGVRPEDAMKEAGNG